MGGIPRRDTSGWAEEYWQELAEVLSGAGTGTGFIIAVLHPLTFSLTPSYADCSVNQGLSCVCSVVVDS